MHFVFFTIALMLRAVIPCWSIFPCFKGKLYIYMSNNSFNHYPFTWRRARRLLLSRQSLILAGLHTETSGLDQASLGLLPCAKTSNSFGTFCFVLLRKNLHAGRFVSETKGNAMLLVLEEYTIFIPVLSCQNITENISLIFRILTQLWLLFTNNLIIRKVSVIPTVTFSLVVSFFHYYLKFENFAWLNKFF